MNTPQIIPPNIPTKCRFIFPAKYSEYLIGSPIKGFFITMVLKIKLLANIPRLKMKKAPYGVKKPDIGFSRLLRSMEEATNL